jgi:hypothetical protein
VLLRACMLLPVMILVLVCELLEAQSLARACVLPLACMLLLALILMLVWILMLPMILMLVLELALVCITIEKSCQFSRIESWVAIMVLAWISNECPPSSYAKAPFRPAITPLVEGI